MKEHIFSVIAILLCFAFLVGVIFAFANIEDTFHLRAEKVQVIVAEGSNYAVIDGDGEIWQFTSRRTFFVGEVITVYFDTLGTESIYDDQIRMK
jgi:hypothetical protein